MEVIIWALLVVLLYLFFFWKPESQYDIASDKKQGVPPNVIQAVIEAVQREKPDEVPLETLFINIVGPSTYSCRFMFLNTQGYYGTQYDVQATISPEGTVHINNMSTSASVDKYDAGFTAYRADKYLDYTDIQKSTENKFQNELTKFRESQLVSGSDQFETKNVTNMYGQNIQRSKEMRDFLQNEPKTSFTNTTSPESSVPGPSPARSGDMIASGDKIASF